MSTRGFFNFKTGEALCQTAERLGIDLPYQEDISPLLEPGCIGDKKVPNRLVIQPMEGADAEAGGEPSVLTRRRYLRYARGGAGMLWFEAAAVVKEGRSNARQLMLTRKNQDHFRKLIDSLREAAFQNFGNRHNLFCVLQLTHAGRYSKPRNFPRPKIAAFNPHLDQAENRAKILSDAQLESLKEKFLNSAQLALEAGFDAVDIKACHGYLMNETLGAFTRKNSRFGGGFENRIQLLADVCSTVSANVPGLILSLRLSGYDGLPFPYGFGFLRESSLEADLTEVKALLRRLCISGCLLVNMSAGNPYLKPHLSRPFDRAAGDGPLPDEYPLEGVKRLLNIAAGVQRHFTDLPVVASGFSWLRQFFPQVGAGVLKRKEASLIGVGRGAFAYPDFPKDLMEKGSMDPSKVCITCSRCSELLRGMFPAGCVIRDPEVYAPVYRELAAGKKKTAPQ